MGRHTEKIEALRAQNKKTKQDAIAAIQAEPLTLLSGQEAMAIVDKLAEVRNLHVKGVNYNRIKNNAPTLLALYQAIDYLALSHQFNTAKTLFTQTPIEARMEYILPEFEHFKNPAEKTKSAEIQKLYQELLDQGWNLLKQEKTQGDRPLARRLAEEMEKAITEGLLRERYPELSSKRTRS